MPPQPAPVTHQEYAAEIVARMHNMTEDEQAALQRAMAPTIQEDYEVDVAGNARFNGSGGSGRQEGTYSSKSSPSDPGSFEYASTTTYSTFI